MGVVSKACQACRLVRDPISQWAPLWGLHIWGHPQCISVCPIRVAKSQWRGGPGVQAPLLFMGVVCLGGIYVMWLSLDRCWGCLYGHETISLCDLAWQRDIVKICCNIVCEGLNAGGEEGVEDICEWRQVALILRWHYWSFLTLCCSLLLWHVGVNFHWWWQCWTHYQIGACCASAFWFLLCMWQECGLCAT